MSRKKTLSMVSYSLCTQCGTCSGICPVSAINMVVDDRRGLFIPEVNGSACIACGSCLKACPSYSVNVAVADAISKKSSVILLGAFIECYLAHAWEREIRYNSASGGLVTSLLIFSLEHGIIDGALVTRMKKDKPFEPEPFIARTKEEIIEASRSKYCPVPANIALKEILKEKGRFAVVGLPCHLNGIRKAEENSEKLAERIVLHLGLFCSHTDSMKATDFFLHKLNIKRDDVAQISYRGEGWPGKIKVMLKNGQQLKVPLADPLWASFHGVISFSPVACLLCNDLTAEQADLSFGDPWLPEVAAIEHEGKSIVISRSRFGEELLKQASSNRHIKLTTLNPAKVIRSQRFFLYFKKTNIKSRLKLMSIIGIMPSLRNSEINCSFTDMILAIFFLFNHFISQIPILRYVPTHLLYTYIRNSNYFVSLLIKKSLLVDN